MPNVLSPAYTSHNVMANWYVDCTSTLRSISRLQDTNTAKTSGHTVRTSRQHASASRSPFFSANLKIGDDCR